MKLKYLLYFELIYKSFLLSYFINSLHKKGDKIITETFIYESFYLIKIKTRENPYLIFFENIEKIKPTLIVKFKTKLKKKKKNYYNTYLY